MMHMTTTGTAALAGGAVRAFAPGIVSFGAGQNARVHTAV
ncbi:hypothetical protein JOD63_001100 [Microbacterium terrae]|uniref:Uncharacterized protein n=1 Tax=Microbacterium terrae TaxID=69369 RepID=A0A0M2H4U6_9MICO|nr:hypothetical protein RS81_02337 [Microbacterium terrae]MBP1077132.1 hypothetical protein [Microbacterium terrae]